jgi:type IV pilus assembly protein PilN
LQSEIKKLDLQIKDVATLQSEIAALRARQQAVEDLQSDRNMPVHLLNELVKQLPDGVYINTLRQDGANLSMQGVAQSNERVSELLRNLANNSVWLSRPELIEIVASTLSLTPRDQRRVSNFSIKAQLRKPAEVQRAAAEAANPGSAAAASAVGASTAKKQ